MQLATAKIGAVAVARTATRNPLELLIGMVESHPSADAEWLFKKWLKQVREDDDLLIPALRHTFTNMLSSIDRSKRDGRTQVYQTARSKKLQRAASKVAARVANVILMNLQLPSGKLLRDATFKECAHAGSFFAQVARYGKPTQVVGKTLTEQDLQAMWKR